MRNFADKNEEIKKQAGADMAIMLDSWKRRRKRLRIYRGCLLVALFLSCAALGGTGYYYIDSSIPSTIYVRAGEEQSFHLGVPAKAEIISVGRQGTSNIPKDAITIDLNQPVKMRAGGLEQ